MATTITGITPSILEWARVRSGQTIEQVAEALDRDPAVIRAWESGEAAPTYVQLETLAYKIYKRPIALFFFPAPPEEPAPEQAFRTLPDFEIDDLSSDTRFKVRQALALQLSLSELSGGASASAKMIIRDLELDASASSSASANRVREYLGLDVARQRSWKTSEEALKEWRSAVERAGIFVFKESFKQKDVSGFSLFHKEFPLIFVNNSTAKTRQMFTIFHELAHLLVHTSGVTKRDDHYIRALHGHAREVEVFCNGFAAHLLVPDSDFKQQDLRTDDQNILRLSRLYKVSREVILRRLLELGRVSQKTYAAKSKQWAQDYFSRSDDEGGGNYYLTHVAYLSETYLRMAFAHYYRGTITLEELAAYLNVKATNVAGIEQVALERIR